MLDHVKHREGGPHGHGHRAEHHGAHRVAFAFENLQFKDLFLKDPVPLGQQILAVGANSSAVSRFFLGSHASKIVRSAPVPVTLVPRRRPEAP